MQLNRSTFEELLRCAGRLGIEVRHASLGGDAGGMAMMRGKRLLVVDIDADPEDQLERTVRALKTVPGFVEQPLRADVKELFVSGGTAPRQA